MQHELMPRDLQKWGRMLGDLCRELDDLQTKADEGAPPEEVAAVYNGAAGIRIRAEGVVDKIAAHVPGRELSKQAMRCHQLLECSLNRDEVHLGPANVRGHLKKLDDLLSDE